MRFFLLIDGGSLLNVGNNLWNGLVFVFQLLMMTLDLDGSSCAKKGRYFLEDPLFFSVFRRGDHGHVLFEKGKIEVLLFHGPIAFPARFFLFLGFFARLEGRWAVLRGGEVDAVLFSKEYCFSMLSLV